MTNKLLILLLVILLACFTQSFILTDTAYLQSFKSKTKQNIQGCLSEDVQTIKEGVSQCENKLIQTTLDCLKYYIQHNMKYPWNIFIQSQNSPDTLSFWAVGNCAIYYPSYGQYHRQMNIWIANPETSTNSRKQSTQKISTEHKQNGDNKLNQKGNLVNKVDQLVSSVGCSQIQQVTVQNAISNCDIEGNRQGGECIQNHMDWKLGQYWNVIIHTRGDSVYEYKVYDGCQFVYENVGYYKRKIIIWKAK